MTFLHVFFKSMSINSIEQENNELKQIELRSEKEVKAIENKLMLLKRELEDRKKSIEELEDQLEIHISKKKKLEENMKHELNKYYPTNKLISHSDTLISVSSTFIQTLLFSQKHTDGSFQQLRIPSVFIAYLDSVASNLRKTIHLEYGAAFAIRPETQEPTGSVEAIMDFIRRVFVLATTHHETEKKAITKLDKMFDSDKFIIFHHGKIEFVATMQLLL